ncbi:alpha-tocopherol transfer [Lasius niger]|uniref:Alpha-tocopherol transfer n=1 Tax=Lasius niger TaxID=67767 RepID=A0A0J7L8U0_LASNI|nr:alpha-tocopherol transfer [Lasius niger]
MISNQLIIRLEKDKNRQKKKREEWDPPCDCVEIQRPTSKRGPKIINADCDDRIVFRVHSTPRFYEKEESPYKSQTIAYKMESCRDEQDSHQCKTITVFPQFTSDSQEVYSDHITEGNQNIFLLRIKKKAEYSEQKNRNVELELRTPKPPTPLPAPAPTPVSAVAPSQPAADLIVEDVKEPHMPEKITKHPAKALKGKQKKKKK